MDGIERDLSSIRQSKKSDIVQEGTDLVNQDSSDANTLISTHIETLGDTLLVLATIMDSIAVVGTRFPRMASLIISFSRLTRS